MSTNIDSKELQTKEGLYKAFQNYSDVQISLKAFHNQDTYVEFLFVYCKGISDSQSINQIVLPHFQQLIKEGQSINIKNLNCLLEVYELTESNNLHKELDTKLFSGELIVLDCQNHYLFTVSIAKPPQRSIEESNMELSTRGPRDGFVESNEVNVALIRKRLKTSSLITKSYNLGKRSNTNVVLLYIQDVINQDLLMNIEKKIEKLEIDVVTSSYQIEELLYDNTFSLFPLVEYTGRPDFVSQSLNQGRFAILVDGNPNCLIAPVNIAFSLKTASDSHNSFFYTSFERVLRIFALFLAVFLPGFWVALTAFQLDQIPYPLLTTIGMSRIGLPLSTPIEVFVMLLFFDLFREASLHLPKAVGQTVAVLGGLIVGDAAIRAGLTSPTTLVIGSISVISSYSLINISLLGNIILVRLFILSLSSILGLYGFFIGLFLLLVVLASLESFGYPYLAPFHKINLGDILKNFLQLPIKFIKNRNGIYNPSDSDRRKE
ncbi:spore germination protein [Bacillus cereus]|uniref:spore germination protein n=1 Tax=Bacillus cereus TaxID=1396 RepID=UPI002404E6B6|nr:spore germination protein [Bacillus cereus]MDF9612870.1 spore germination protein [Bacillus cereus]